MKLVPAFWRLVLALAVLVPASGAFGQQFTPIKVPDTSPEASVGQSVGLTDIRISYHRPAVNKREIWGKLVPYNEVWRAGANENTTISFSSDVTVGGQKLAAGTYGLHMLPTEKDWTVIFSNMASAWGSFSYDPKEDAARVTVTPQPAEFQERLGYAFEDPTDTAAVVAMRWEKVKVAFPVTVDTPQVVLASIRRDLRGLPRFAWQGWNQAAAYCLRANINLEEALQWSDRSLALNQTFTNLRVKAGLLEKKGDVKDAEALRARSLALATEVEMNAYGYQLLGQKKMDEAIDAFKKNVKDHPESWNVYDSLAEAYATKGDKKLATDNYTRALSMAPDAQKKRITDALTKLKA
jgi:tetratricopeptide (TPR) repeat protein